MRVASTVCCYLIMISSQHNGSDSQLLQIAAYSDSAHKKLAYWKMILK